MRLTIPTSIKLGLILMLGIILNGCNQNHETKNVQPATPDHAILTKIISDHSQEFSKLLKQKDSIGLVNMYTDDAVIMPSTQGKTAIMGMFGGMIRSGVINSQFETTGVWGNNELLVEQGKGIWSDENGAVLSTGTYLVVWKNIDGTWKIFRDSWFPDK